MPEDISMDPMMDPDCCYYDVETNKFYRLEYDEHWEPKNFKVNEEGIITFLGNKEDYVINQKGEGTIVVNHQELSNTIAENPSPEPVSEEKKKRGRPKKNP